MKIRTKARVLGGVSIISAAVLMLVTFYVVNRLYEVSRRLDHVQSTLSHVRAADELATEILFAQGDRVIAQWKKIRTAIESDITALSDDIGLPQGTRTEILARIQSIDQTITRFRKLSGPLGTGPSRILMNRLNADRYALTARVETFGTRLEAERRQLLNTTAILIALAVLASSVLVIYSSYHLRQEFLRAFDEINAATQELRPGEATREILTSRRDEVGDLLRQMESARLAVSESFAAQSSARERAEELSAAKTAFIATTSHELRTPLNGLIGSIQMLAKSGLSDAQMRYLRMAETSGEALLAVVNDVLDFSKIESGHMEIENVTFRPLQVLEDVHSMFVSTAEQRGLEFERRFDVRTDDRLVGDPTRLRQILNNLVGNALKFTHEGRVSVAASLRPIDGTDLAALVVEVSDTGVGIAEGKLAQIFNPFFQSDQSTTRKYGGSGLGLAISSQLAKAMGGDLTLSSVEGEGTTVTLALQLPFSAEEELAPQEVEAVPSADGQLAGLRVLIVDDVDINRMVATAVLRGWDCLVAEAENGQEAVESVEQAQFDAILMDVQMPVMDGLEATAAIRRMGITTPIVGMTANAFSEQRRQYLAGGMDDVVPKPVDWEQLHDVLARIADGADDTEGAPEAEAASGHEDLIDLATIESLRRTMSPRRFATICEQAVTFAAQACTDIASAASEDERRQIAHALKGVAGNVGFNRVRRLAERVEFGDASHLEMDIAALEGVVADTTAWARKTLASNAASDGA